MVEVTEVDKKLLQDLAINLGNGGSRHNREQLVATHREAAAKAERDRYAPLIVASKNLRQYWADVERYKEMDAQAMIFRATEMRRRDSEVKHQFIAALADALESKP